MLSAEERSPSVVKARLSEERYAPPEAARLAPPVAAELSQPRPAPVGGFPQGQRMTPPEPPSQRLVKSGRPNRSRTKTSFLKFVSPGTRLLAQLLKTTYRPSSEACRQV